MIMTVFVLIHADHAKVQVVYANIIPSSTPIISQNETVGFLPEGWRVCRSELHSMKHFLGV